MSVVLTCGGQIKILDQEDKTYIEYCIELREHYVMLQRMAKKLDCKSRDYTDKIDALTRVLL